MGYLGEIELRQLGFKYLGENVKISDKASIDKPERITLHDHARVDDFCALSGEINLGRNVHIAVHCSITASREPITLSDFSGLAFNCHLFSSSDDYSGRSLTNPTVPSEYKEIQHGRILLGKHVILGAGTIVFPGVEIADGCATGAMTVVTKSTEPWGVYLGAPAKRIKERKRDLLELETHYLQVEMNTRKGETLQ
jgi:acetyltransferase-like isoleucine patch superfamily enzyme